MPGEKKRFSSGLFNSARFVQEMLARIGHETKLVHVIDNNCIDREVRAFRPDVVVIEAYWVVPEKFDVLFPLHKNVTWVVRNHSATPFAATEGIIMDWSLRYMDHPNVVLSCNDDRTHEEFRRLVMTYKPEWTPAQVDSRVIYLPNYYPVPKHIPHVTRGRDKNFIDVSCFGAVRPLKNHLMQAVAAIKFAEDTDRILRFHINGTRLEGRGEPVLHNIQKMFRLLPHVLVEHNWMPHSDFKELVSQMDIGLQVSYTETFNIVTADMVTAGVPVVTGPDVRWVHPMFRADPNDCDSIVNAMHRSFFHHRYLKRFWNPTISRLRCYNERSIFHWASFLCDVEQGQRPVE